MTRREKKLVREYAIARERKEGTDVVKVRFMNGDARAYCSDGYSYFIDPLDILLAEAQAAPALQKS